MTPTVSFEFFPPKTPELEHALWRAVDRLAPLKPAFVSVTYGAGGSTRARTHEIVTRLQRERHLSAAAHLTCVGASRAEIDEIARQYWQAGIRHIVALRGDPPEGGPYQPHPEGYAYTSDLIRGLKALAPFEISAGGYPEIHPDAGSLENDLARLKSKVEAGASRIITQFFFDKDVFFRFLERVQKAGLDVPVVPGLLPIVNFARATSFAQKCGASLPAGFARLFDGFDEAPPLIRQQMAEEALAEQCLALKAGGVTHFHFYTLNRAELVVAACRHLGVEPVGDEHAA